MADKFFYKVPETFSGKTLAQIGDERGFGNLQGVSSLLGISNAEPLTAGKTFEVAPPPGVDPAGSSEFQVLRNIFEAGLSPEERFQQEQRERLGEFTGRLGEVPDQLAAVRQALRLPEAFETFGQAGTQARELGYLVEDLPQSVQQALSGQGVTAGQIKGRTSAEIQNLQPALTAASRTLESSQAGLSNLLNQYQTETANIFTPLEIEAGLLGDNIAQEFGLFKQKIGADLQRELAQLQETGATDRANIERAIRLAEIEAASEQGEFRDLGDRIALINPFTGQEISSFDKGLAPKRVGTLTEQNPGGI